MTSQNVDLHSFEILCRESLTLGHMVGSPGRLNVNVCILCSVPISEHEGSFCCIIDGWTCHQILPKSLVLGGMASSCEMKLVRNEHGHFRRDLCNLLEQSDRVASQGLRGIRISIHARRRCLIIGAFQLSKPRPRLVMCHSARIASHIQPWSFGQIGARTNGRHILFFEFKILDENLEVCLADAVLQRNSEGPMYVPKGNEQQFEIAEHVSVIEFGMAEESKGISQSLEKIGRLVPSGNLT